jgi:nucleotide-binding universal stress UspA family protein
MTKTILVPTDLQVASLRTLKVALEHGEESPSLVILLYAELLTDSISNLLFYSPDKLIDSKITDEFREALEILKNRFGKKIGSISIRLFHGHNSRAMNNFLEANGVDHIFIPSTYKLKTNIRAFDPIPMIRRSAVPFTEITWDRSHPGKQDQLTSLLH